VPLFSPVVHGKIYRIIYAGRDSGLDIPHLRFVFAVCPVHQYLIGIVRRNKYITEDEGGKKRERREEGKKKGRRREEEGKERGRREEGERKEKGRRDEKIERSKRGRKERAATFLCFSCSSSCNRMASFSARV
jgi:hypothetical protein